MKRLLSIILSGTLAISAIAQQSSDTLRVLCIGNSFSVGATKEDLGEIAAADGKTVIVSNLYIGGCSLQMHRDNMLSGAESYTYYKRVGTQPCQRIEGKSLQYGLADEKWDIITFQQVSGKSGLPQTYEPYLSELVGYVKEHSAPQTRLMWLQTWSYANYCTHPDFTCYDRSSSQMFRAISDASRKVVEEYGFGLIPCGAAIQAARSTYIGPNITGDGFHLNGTGGCYIAALTFYAAICGHPFSESPYCPSLVRPDVKDIANRAAELAILHPYDIYPIPEHSQRTFRGKWVSLDESTVPDYTLPDPLRFENGRKVRTSRQWMESRRQEILDLFCENEYGYVPGKPDYLKFEKMTEDSCALGGLATRREIRIRYADHPDACFILLEYVPNAAKGKVPMFLSPVFRSNLAVSDDPGVSEYKQSDLNRIAIGNCFDQRGALKQCYPLEKILSSGYGFAAVYCCDMSTDADTSWWKGPFRFFFKEGQWRPADNEWGTISAWAWCLSRCLDYLETDEDVDAKRVAVVGHSRLGKTALWTAALDQRFAMSISSCSGCCGAAIARRRFGENFMTITADFPYWFCRNFYNYRGREDEFPVDQHELIALVAPRPVYVSSGTEDLWADPKGEELAASEARKVYRLFGRKAVSKVGYHIHEGPHQLNYFDWDHYLEFAGKYL